MGLVKDTIRLANQASFFKKDMELLIRSIPVISAIKPSIMVPMPFFFSDFPIYSNIPMIPISGASVEGLKNLMRKLSPSKPDKERIQAVTVVPMLEPMITPTACFSVIIPELTKPTTMTVVAEEDWITAVTPIPSKKPLNTLLLIFARMVCNLPPA